MDCGVVDVGVANEITHYFVDLVYSGLLRASILDYTVAIVVDSHFQVFYVFVGYYSKRK